MEAAAAADLDPLVVTKPLDGCGLQLDGERREQRQREHDDVLSWDDELAGAAGFVVWGRLQYDMVKESRGQRIRTKGHGPLGATGRPRYTLLRP